MRCQHPECKHRLSLSDKSVPCKCRGVFCPTHRFYAMHDCTHDYRSDTPPTLNPKKVRSNEYTDCSNTAF